MSTSPARSVTEGGPGDRGTRPSLAVRWGIWVARRRWWVLGAWVAILFAASASYPHLIRSLVATDYSVTGSESAAVAKLMEGDFAAAGAEQDVIAFDSGTLTIGDPAYRRTVERVLARARAQPGVVSVVGPTAPAARDQVSADGHAALATVGLAGDDRQRGNRAAELQDSVAAAAAGSPVDAYLTGYSPVANDLTEVENTDVERAESIGVPVAFVVLVLALGAVVAAFVPLITAAFALMATYGVLAAATGFASFDALLLSIVTMIGVGVSIDYSLFVLTRFREELVRRRREGHPDPVPAAVGTAMTTSGRTIAFSGAIVMVSLFSLFVVHAPLFREIAAGAVLVVACTLITAWTMLPALLAALGDRVDRWALPARLRPRYEEPASAGPGGWERWARTVLARPWLALPAVAFLLLLALPMLGLRFGIDLGLSSLADEPSGKAEQVLARSFSPGALSPIQIVASHRGPGELDSGDLAAIGRLTARLERDPRVAAVYSITGVLEEEGGAVSPRSLAALEAEPRAKPLLAQVLNIGDGSNRTIVTVVPGVPIDSNAATELVKDIRDRVIPAQAAGGGPQMLVGGTTAQFVDLSAESIGKLPLVVALVLALSFLYLMAIFRSLLIPAKAVLMNLLATAAAFGLVTWVFQDGHLSGLLGFTGVGYIQTFLPITVFALLFGLSMDYEVFLIRSMQERWLETHDNDDAVATGLARTARPILAAAAIMAAVFGCFLVADVLELKEFGLALAAAVVIDATLVRLLLVPAIMKVAGRANWWLPAWLGRLLPTVRLD